MSTKLAQAQARAALAAGRVRTFSYAPYLASYIYSLSERPSPGTRTCGVSMDGVLHWDPDFVDSLGTDTLAYVILHECLHLIFRHHTRATEAYGSGPTPEQQLAMNIAGDLVIEQVLAFMRPLRPAGAVHLGAECKQLGIKLDFPENKDMIEYYTMIMSAVRQRPRDDGGGTGGGDESSDSEHDGECSGDAPRSSKRGQSKEGARGSRQQKNGASTRVMEPGSGGSACDGVRRPHEHEDDSWRAYKENLYATKLEESIKDCERSSPGTVPGILRESLDRMLHPQPDPFARLKSAVATSTASPIGGRIATYQRMSRKQPPGMCKLRGLRSTQASAVVIVDTSGSMSDRETKIKALQVIADGLRKLKSVKVVCADTHVRNSATLRDLDKFVWEGGGGTDMAEALTHVDKEDRPDNIVLITDGITGWPSRPTRARVIVALTEDSSYYGNVPAWCRTVPLF